MDTEVVKSSIAKAQDLFNSTGTFASNQYSKVMNLNLSSPVDYVSDYVSHWYKNSGKTEIPGTHRSSLFGYIKCNKVNLAITTVGLGLGIGGLWYWNKPAKRVRRRVPKLPNGARQDVILIVGSPTEPLTRLIALDFERRGFIVYLTILDDKDFRYTESNPITDDINYLNLTNSENYEQHFSKFQRLLETPVIPFNNAEPHTLKLVSVVFTPNLYFPIGPMENISLASWNKLINKVSIYFKLFASGFINLVRNQNSKVILITPSITSSLNLPFHGPEAWFQNSLQSLFSTVTREVTLHGLSVTQVKLGNISVLSTNSTLKTSSLINSEVQSWHDDIKILYQTSFTDSQFRISPIRSTGKGSHLRDLYHTLYDLIYSKSSINPPIVYCGSGARSYDWISAIFPASFILWLLI